MRQGLVRRTSYSRGPASTTVGATLDLADALVTTTGANQPNLVVRASVLQAGNEYFFKLTATYPGQNPGESSLLPYEPATFIP